MLVLLPYVIGSQLLRMTHAVGSGEVVEMEERLGRSCIFTTSPGIPIPNHSKVTIRHIHD